MERPSTVFSIVAVVATGLVAYAFYFDYKRRNDVDFRKKLRGSFFPLASNIIV